MIPPFAMAAAENWPQFVNQAELTSVDWIMVVSKVIAARARRPEFEYTAGGSAIMESNHMDAP